MRPVPPPDRADARILARPFLLKFQHFSSASSALELLRRAYEQRPEAVQQWLATEYPIIRDQAKSEGGEIYWGDETGLRTDCQHGRGYARKGQTPVISLNARRESIKYDLSGD